MLEKELKIMRDNYTIIIKELDAIREEIEKATKMLDDVLGGDENENNNSSETTKEN